MSWPQAFLGGWGISDLPAKYGFQGIPANVLIDPGGRILARNLPSDDLEKEIANALKGT